MMQPTPARVVDVKRTDTSGLAVHHRPQRRHARRPLEPADHPPGVPRHPPLRRLPAALGIGRNILTQRLDATRRRRPAHPRRVPAEPATLRVPPHRQGPRRLPDPRRHGGLGRPVAHRARRHARSCCTTPRANTTCTPSWSAASAPNHSTFATSAPRPDPASRTECPRTADVAARCELGFRHGSSR